MPHHRPNSDSFGTASNQHLAPSKAGKSRASSGLSARSASSFRQRLVEDGEHLSPVTPMHPAKHAEDDTEALKPSQPRSLIKKALFNLSAILLVVTAGVAGFFLSPASHNSGTETYEEQEQSLKFSLWGQIFGYVCAALYLGSRIPQLLLNYRRKSVEGLNALFFLFACIGNLTYVLSILAFDPICADRHGHCRPGEARRIYTTYFLLNLSWLLGSFGTLLLDFGVFTQFWMYRHAVAEQDTAIEDDAPMNEDGEGRGRAPSQR